MKRLAFYLAVSFCTFFIGLAGVLTNEYSNQVTKCKRKASDVPYCPMLKPVESQIEVGFKTMSESGIGGQRFAIFTVKNKTGENIYFKSYSKGYIVDYWIRQNNITEKATNPDYNLGMEEHHLKPDELSDMEILVPLQNKQAKLGFNQIELGFTFEVGEDRQPETVWLGVTHKRVLVSH